MAKADGGIPLYLFHEGTNARAYEFLGAHPSENGEVVFRVWAPNVQWAGVSGDFNGWDAEQAAMQKSSRPMNRNLPALGSFACRFSSAGMR